MMGYGSIAEEMAIDLETYYSLEYQKYINFNLLNHEQKTELDKLAYYFQEREGTYDTDFWDDNKLGQNPEWIWVREQAKKIITLLHFDSLSIVHHQIEKFDSSGDPAIQTTYLQLIRT